MILPSTQRRHSSNEHFIQRGKDRSHRTVFWECLEFYFAFDTHRAQLPQTNHGTESVVLLLERTQVHCGNVERLVHGSIERHGLSRVEVPLDAALPFLSSAQTYKTMPKQ